MEIGSSAFAAQGTVANSTTPYYIPADGATNSLTVGDLAVTNNATVNNITVNDTITVINNLFTPLISYAGDITINATNDGGGGVILSAPVDTGTTVFRRFGLFDCLGSATFPIPISATPFNMHTSKGFFQGNAGDSGEYVFTFNPGYNPNPFAIIQSIDGTATNVQYWEITGPGQLTVHGPGGASVARFSMIIL
jgi:hypothetical protein